MRSGSTLLKAILATRAEVTNLPETPRHIIHSILSNVTQKIIVIKRPRGYFFDDDYPGFFVKDTEKGIIIVRNPYDTVISLHKMNIINHWKRIFDFNEHTLLQYWKNTYERLLKLSNKKNILVTKYESLTKSPIEETSRIFRFVNTLDKSGTNVYNHPNKFNWKWGTDDGGELIKTLKVQYSTREFSNKKLIKLIRHDCLIQDILKRFGYSRMFPELICNE